MAESSARRGATILVPAVIVINQSVGVVCQFAQGTDPRFPLLYFTVDSAILAGLVAAMSLVDLRWRWLPAVRHTAAVGVLTSAIIFATVIAPATPTGTWIQPYDDIPVQVATILMHAVAPVLVVVDYILRPAWGHAAAIVMWTYLWPLLYLFALFVLAAVIGGDVVPYPFLRPSQVGWHTVAVAMVALTALVGLLGTALAALNRVGMRKPRRADM